MEDYTYQEYPKWIVTGADGEGVTVNSEDEEIAVDAYKPPKEPKAK
jgi:hypothetical protein